MPPSLQRITLITLTLFVGCLSLGSAAHAEKLSQTEEKPRIKALLSSPQGLLDDLKYLIVDLAKEKRQWEENIQPTIEIFLFGVDYNKPLRWDVLVNNQGPDETSGYRFQPSIPLEPGPRGLKRFRKNNLQDRKSVV